MTKICLSLLLSCFITFFYAQTTVYHPYNLNNVEWYYEHAFFDGSSINYNYSHKYWGGDTTIQGQLYVKTDMGAIRQDVVNQTLFFRDLNGEEFDITINQFLEVGDTLFLTRNLEVATAIDLLPYFVVDSFAIIKAIDSISFMGNNRKSYIFHFENFQEGPKIELVLGLGVIQAIGFENREMLICYSTNNQLLYGASENPMSINCTANTKELDKLNFKIYPSPAKEFIELHFDPTLGNIDCILITDLLGKQLKEIIAPKSPEQINISNWEDGVYLVSLKSNGFVSQKKFIKTQ